MIRLIILSLLVGCSALQVRVEKEDLKKIKTVALVGITSDEMKLVNKGSMLDSFLGSEDEMAKGWGKFPTPNVSEHVVDLYNSLNGELVKSLNFKTLPYANVSNSKEILKISSYSKKMDGNLAQEYPLKPGYERFYEGSIPQYFHVARMTVDQKVALAKSLGVDALAYARMETSRAQYKVAGIKVGKISSRTTMYLSVFDVRKKKEVLSAVTAGESIKSAESKFMGVGSEKEGKILAGKAIDSAQTVLFNRINEKI